MNTATGPRTPTTRCASRPNRPRSLGKGQPPQRAYPPCRRTFARGGGTPFPDKAWATGSLIKAALTGLMPLVWIGPRAAVLRAPLTVIALNVLTLAGSLLRDPVHEKPGRTAIGVQTSSLGPFRRLDHAAVRLLCRPRHLQVPTSLNGRPVVPSLPPGPDPGSATDCRLQKRHRNWRSGRSRALMGNRANRTAVRMANPRGRA